MSSVKPACSICGKDSYSLTYVCKDDYEWKAFCPNCYGDFEEDFEVCSVYRAPVFSYGWDSKVDLVPYCDECYNKHVVIETGNECYKNYDEDTINLPDTIDFLNHLLEIDREAIERLVETRVLCSEKLADHPTVQVHCINGSSSVGFLGILNGLLGTFGDGPKKGWGKITAVFDDENKLISFKKTENK